MLTPQFDTRTQIATPTLHKSTKINDTYSFKIDQNYKGFTYIYIYIYILKEHKIKKKKKRGRESPLQLQGDIHEIILIKPSKRRSLHSTI